VTLDPTERGDQVLRENPYLGVSCRIVEQYSRSDGKFYPACVQHVLGTLDPRIPGLGAWEPVQLSNGGGAVIIDLSASSWAGEPGPYGDLSDRELNDLIEVMDEVYGEDDGGELPDDELEALMRAAETGEAMGEFNAVFEDSWAQQQAREDARAAAIVEDVLHPARRDEDRMARVIARAQAGVYDAPAALGFAGQSAAIELAVATGQGPCGPVDEYGRCSSRYHELGCLHGVSVDWLASGPPRETYEASLANAASGFDLSNEGIPVWDDYDDPDAPPSLIPQQTVELAYDLADSWGLHADAPSFPPVPGYADLLRPPGLADIDPYAALASGIGLDVPQPAAGGYPGVHELAQGLGLA
jgi:hypothetical protein